MSLQADILSLLLNREEWEKYGHHVGDFFLSDTYKELYKYLRKAYDSGVFDGNLSISSGDLLNYIVSISGINPSPSKVTDYKSALNDCDPGRVVAPALVTEMLNKSTAYDLRTLSQDVYDGSSEMDEIRALMQAYEDSLDSLRGRDSGDIVPDLKLLADSVVKDGYEWSHKEFDDAFGPINGGDLIVFGARPNIGKTSMLANQACALLRQLPHDRTVVWLCNEESGKRVFLRTIGVGINWTFEDIREDPERATELWEDTYGPISRLVIKHRATFTLKDAERYCDKADAGGLILDQLRKFAIPGFKGEEYLRLQKLYEGARGLAIQQDIPIFVVHQADNSAQGQKHLNISQLHGSNTDIQGEADALIMIGVSDDPMEEDYRYINICKNKKAGGDPEKRNEMFHLLFHGDTGRYE